MAGNFNEQPATDTGQKPRHLCTYIHQVIYQVDIPLARNRNRALSVRLKEPLRLSD